MSDGENLKKATFGAGCFWHVEEAFCRIPGVVSTSVGYSGGTIEYPTYEQVCSDITGHAEVVEIVYDPSKVSYEELLRVFWEIHDPTTPNRQGLDIGSQYRSVIFYHDPEQESTARAVKEQLQSSKRFGDRKIYTEILPASKFYRAEEYHQKYLQKHGITHCRI